MTKTYTERQKVWIALSDLFLDTDVSLHVDYIAKVLANSPFSEADLSLILRDEVAPVCLPNLYDVAGEWAGFEEEWLIRAIETKLKRPKLVRFLSRPARAFGLAQYISQWPVVLDLVRAKRAQSSLKGNLR